MNRNNKMNAQQSTALFLLGGTSGLFTAACLWLAGDLGSERECSDATTSARYIASSGILLLGIFAPILTAKVVHYFGNKENEDSGEATYLSPSDHHPPAY